MNKPQLDNSNEVEVEEVAINIAIKYNSILCKKNICKSNNTFAPVNITEKMLKFNV